MWFFRAERGKTTYQKENYRSAEGEKRFARRMIIAMKTPRVQTARVAAQRHANCHIL
jgi:hypothetical protein